MVRLAPPGHGRIEFARTLEVDVGGGEFNVGYACARLGLRSGFVSKLPDNPVARIILNHARAVGMDVSHVLLEKFDGVGRKGRVGLNFTEVGTGVRASVTMYDRGHSSISYMKPGEIDWRQVFGGEGARWLHTGGILASLSENSAELAGYKADLYIVAAFGQILPQSVLDQPRYGTLNIHASLLPKYRGADPIAETILQGDKETGISIMLLDAGVDTGPVLLQRSLVIADGDTTSSLTVRLAEIGAQALLEALPLWVGGTLVPEPQNEEKASHTRMLRKEDGLIDWSRPASVIARQVRAYSPWPSAYTYWGGKLCKVLKVQVQAVTSEKEIAPGMVGVRELAGHQVLGVATGSGVLILQQLQLEGKKAMSAEEFLHGYAQIVGQKLGER